MFLRGAAATLAASRSLGALAAASVSDPAVTFDARSLSVHGKRALLLCGEMHYSRSTRAMWPDLLDRSKALGLNSIAVYVFWNQHEPERDVYDFAGERDLGHFLDLCKERGLLVFLRVGPYCCAEWNFGGFPPYLRDEPGITIRTMSEPYLQRVQKYFERLALEIKPHLATVGGPVALIQVENEYANVAKRYGEAGQQYLRWMVAVAKRVGFANVPITCCEGGAPGSIETANGDTFPAEKVAKLRAEHPNAPLLWSESYPGWYEIWGGEPHTPRDPRDLALDTLDFIAAGGAGFNYYMWHGGTNFGRTSMYLQATSYDFHAPLDEFGRPSLLGEYLGAMHRALAESTPILLDGDRSQASVAPDITKTDWTLGGHSLTIWVNSSKTPYTTAGVTLPPLSARLTGLDGKTLFDTHETLRTVQAVFHAPEWSDEAKPGHWLTWHEPMPADRADDAQRSIDPVEQLSLTKDRTDYTWYSTRLSYVADAERTLTIPYGGDLFYLYLDGKLAGMSELPLHENRGPITPEDPAHPRILANRHEKETVGFHHQFTLPEMSPGAHRLDILSVAVGMIKGDWQIASPMNMERKGIWEGVQWNGKPLQQWKNRPYLSGEKHNLAHTPSEVHWEAVSMAAAPRPPMNWYRTTFPLTAATLAANADFRIDANGLGKGSLFVNGFAVGRHWLIAKTGAVNEPTQRFYHVPRAWLKPRNEMILFEETNATPHLVTLQMRRYDA
jgi:beta-galactosidase